MSGQGFKNRKKFVRDVNKTLGKGVNKRRTWPELQEGECVYLVKNRTTGQRREVVAPDRFLAELLAFPFKNRASDHEIRSMPLHCYKPKKEETKDEQE